MFAFMSEQIYDLYEKGWVLYFIHNIHSNSIFRTFWKDIVGSI